MDVQSHIINIQVECSLAYINKAVAKDDKGFSLVADIFMEWVSEAWPLQA